jgi:cell division protein FtsB
VLKRALPDMVFFGFVFVVSMLSFSTLFYVQLGPVMMEYSTQTSAFISLARALFGDFDIDAILSNSSGYINAIYFIAYLFVAVFILLSMFFAILGESQANVRDDQRDARKAAKQDGTSLAPEYGIITHAYQWAQGSLSRVPIVGAAIQSMLATKTAVEFKTAVEESGPTAVDRMEARQLEMLDGLQELFGGVHRGLETVANRCDELRGAMPASHGGASESAVNGNREQPGASTAGAAMNGGAGGGAGGDAKDAGLVSQVAAIHSMMQAQQQQQQQLAAAVTALSAQFEQLRKRRAHTRQRGSPETRELLGA